MLRKSLCLLLVSYFNIKVTRWVALFIYIVIKNLYITIGVSIYTSTHDVFGFVIFDFNPYCLKTSHQFSLDLHTQTH